MKHKRIVSLFVLAWIIMLALAACFRRETPPGPNMAGGSYESAGYDYFLWQEGLGIMIWHDAIQSSTCDSGGAVGDATNLTQCAAVSESGSGFTWQIETADGRSAQIQIDNQQFDLANGTVFLVKTAGGETEIQQLQRDLSGVTSEGSSITTFGLADPEISQFVQAISPDE
ncbi:neocarzinostatin apoprotein domain-containing protein [Candidatus Leptofilum sp.]|uniref:neocarzinostatin apoprotein domain-containing protein n=1 Tax=Candidatus Leptofilum sp. TaxID=3241576 RepID=UPI003B591EB3